MRQWPTLEDLEEARRRYPTPMFETREELHEATRTEEGEQRVYERFIVWEGEPIES